MSKKNRAGSVTVTENGDAIYSPGARVEESMPDGGPVQAQEAQGKPKETKAQKFRRLAQRRVQKALDVLGKIIPLANKGQYDYTEEDAAQILQAMRGVIDDIEKAFAGQQRARPTFQLR